MSLQNLALSPYAEALAWINQHPGTGSSESMAKLILSFWNGECSFTFRECIGNLDNRLTQVALRMAAQFARHGGDDILIAVGHEVCKRFPRLWEASQAMHQARVELRERWHAADQAERDKRYGNDASE